MRVSSSGKSGTYHDGNSPTLVGPRAFCDVVHTSMRAVNLGNYATEGCNTATNGVLPRARKAFFASPGRWPSLEFLLCDDRATRKSNCHDVGDIWHHPSKASSYEIYIKKKSFRLVPSATICLLVQNFNSVGRPPALTTCVSCGDVLRESYTCRPRYFSGSSHLDMVASGAAPPTREYFD